MNGISSRQKPSGPSAASMKGRRRPSGVWNVSLQGPITGDSASANTPSAPSTRPISVPDSVKRWSNGGKYAAVVVIEKASPNAPRPRVQKSLRRTAGSRAAAGAVSWATKLERRRLAVRSQASAHDLDHCLLSRCDLLVGVVQLTEHPAGQDLLQRTVEHIADHAGLEVGAKFTVLLSAGDDPFQRSERLVDLDDAALQVRAARDLAHEHAHEIGIPAPRAQQDLRHAGESFARALVRLFDGADR